MKNYDYMNSDLPFNSSFEFLKRIERRWEDCDNSKLAGDTMSYFRTLETIFRNTHPFFKNEEVAECEEYVKKIEKLLENKDRAFMAASIWIGENQCDKFRMLLVTLLFKYKITYAKKEKVTLEDEVEDDF